MPIIKNSGFTADLHIHIGRAMGKPVKITAARSLTLASIIYQDAPRKGLDIVGVVDSATMPVKSEIEAMVHRGDLMELSQGGFMAGNGVLLVSGSEVETREGIHVIVYLPGLDSLSMWQQYLSTRVRNMGLSTQKVDASVTDIVEVCQGLEGIFCLAHAFTPHKGAYGAWTDKLAPQMGPLFRKIKVLELGLSSDSYLADTLSETCHFNYLSNSDAHSSPNIGREFNLLDMQEKSFAELFLCLNGIRGRRIAANYGLHPRMGKYHRTYCPFCDFITEDEPPVTSCRICGSDRIIMGVLDRIVSISDFKPSRNPVDRPPYYYRVPLKDLPGVGPVIYKKLLQSFANEIKVMEEVPIEAVKIVAGEKIAAVIHAMRSDQLCIGTGGGGKYGRVSFLS